VRGKLRNLGLAAVVTVVIMLMVAVATAGTDLVGRLKINPTAIRLAARRHHVHSPPSREEQQQSPAGSG
jgi:hypothetical protein